MAKVAKGSNSQLLMAQEAVYGQKPAADKFVKVPMKSCSLDGSQELIENDDIGMGREQQAPVQGRKSISGDVKVSVDSRNLGYYLKGLLGSAVTTETAGVFTHVFSSGKEELPSFSIEKGLKEVNDYSIFSGVMFNQMNFDFQSDGLTSMTVDLLGQSEENNETSINLAPTSLEYTQFAGSNGFARIDGVEVTMMSASLSLSNNMEEIKSIRSDNKNDGVDVGLFNATGSVVVRFNDKALLQKAVEGTPIALDIGYERSENEKVTFKLLEAYLSKPAKSIDGPGGIELSFDFKASKNKVAEKAVEVELINDVETY